MTKYTLGAGYKIARNHAICNGPFIVAVVRGAGYPIGEGWAPETEAKAQRICDLLNADEAKRESDVELLAALKRVAPWLGKLIADGGHMNSVAPNDAVGALQQAEAAIARASSK